MTSCHNQSEALEEGLQCHLFPRGDKQDRKLTRIDKLGLMYHNDSLSHLALGVFFRGFFRGLLRGAAGRDDCDKLSQNQRSSLGRWANCIGAGYPAFKCLMWTSWISGSGKDT